MKKYIVYLLFLNFLSSFSDLSFALEEGGQLTVRFLQVSDSKKTLLLNRGSDDGLTEGKHGKFFLTKGVLARALCEKVSPNRSIWSVYRLVSSDDIIADAVAKLEITQEFKLTEDKTRVIGDNENSSLIPGQTDEEMKESFKKERAVASVEDQSFQTIASSPVHVFDSNNKDLHAFHDKSTWEIWAKTQLNMMSQKKVSDSTAVALGNSSLLDFSFGIEKYFDTQNSFWRKLSLFALFHLYQIELSTFDGRDTAKKKVFGVGGGANFHFNGHGPFIKNYPIFFSSLAIGGGSSVDNLSFSGTVSSSSVNYTQEYNGQALFFAFGLGLKLFFTDSFGFNALADFYFRQESYLITENGQDLNYYKRVMGPRILFGLSYRF